jgi:SAM-dependent methyltransferase
MIEQARRLNPQLTFQHGDMLHLDLPADALTGVVAFYSLIHIARPKVVAALKEIKRVLRPDGLLLFSFHVGSETVHLDEWWSCPVNLDFEFFGVSEVSEYLRQADFQLEEVIEREPYAPAVEHQSRRAYVFARRPAR